MTLFGYTIHNMAIFFNFLKHRLDFKNEFFFCYFLRFPLNICLCHLTQQHNVKYKFSRFYKVNNICPYYLLINNFHYQFSCIKHIFPLILTLPVLKSACILLLMAKQEQKIKHKAHLIELGPNILQQCYSIPIFIPNQRSTLVLARKISP